MLTICGGGQLYCCNWILERLDQVTNRSVLSVDIQSSDRCVMHRKSCLSGGDQAFWFWIYQSSRTFCMKYLEFSVRNCQFDLVLLDLNRSLSFTTLCCETRRVPFHCHVYGVHLRFRIEDKAVFQLLIPEYPVGK